jgi:hypothetical protein
MHSAILDVQTDLGIVAQVGSNRVDANTIDFTENHFGLLVAIGSVLRQFSVASRLE